jgi:hypothetical protein
MPLPAPTRHSRARKEVCPPLRCPRPLSPDVVMPTRRGRAPLPHHALGPPRDPCPYPPSRCDDPSFHYYLKAGIPILSPALAQLEAVCPTTRVLPASLSHLALPRDGCRRVQEAEPPHSTELAFRVDNSVTRCYNYAHNSFNNISAFFPHPQNRLSVCSSPFRLWLPKR